MSDQGPGSDQPSPAAAESPLNSQILAAVEEAQRALRDGVSEDSQNILRLQIAHSLSLALADAVAYVRRLQTLALASQSAAQRAILDGLDPDTAGRVADLGQRAVVKSTREVLALARAASSLAAEEGGATTPSQEDLG